MNFDIVSAIEVTASAAVVVAGLAYVMASTSSERVRIALLGALDQLRRCNGARSFSFHYGLLRKAV